MKVLSRCAQHSNARRGAKTPRNLPLADSLVLRGQELSSYWPKGVLYRKTPDRTFEGQVSYGRRSLLRRGLLLLLRLGL